MLADDGQKQQEVRALRQFVATLVFGVALTLSGCGSAQHLSEMQRQAMNRAASAPPILEPGEKIRVTVYGEPSLSGTYWIDPGGFIPLPLAGPLKVDGLSEAELVEALKERLSRGYLKNPHVVASITEFLPFYISGEVRKSGVYSYSAGMNVFNAIAIAGGLTYRANRSTIMIQHRDETVMRTYRLSWPIPVLPGDIVRLPLRYF